MPQYIFTIGTLLSAIDTESGVRTPPFLTNQLLTKDAKRKHV